MNHKKHVKNMSHTPPISVQAVATENPNPVLPVEPFVIGTLKQKIEDRVKHTIRLI